MPQRAFDAVTEMMIALFRAGAERLMIAVAAKRWR